MKKTINRERARYCRLIYSYMADALSEFCPVEPSREPSAPDVMEDEYIVEGGLNADDLRYEIAPLAERLCRRIHKEFRGRLATWQVRVEETQNSDEYRVVLIASLGVVP